MGKKFGLGKGLGALIPEQNSTEDKKIVDETKSIDQSFIPLNSIKTNKEQPRKYFDGEKIGELAESIKQHGIIQPLVLKKEGDFYVVIAGERRLRAAKYLGLKEVPAIIKDLTDKDILEISLIENIQRENLNPIEEAIAYNKLIKEFNLKQEELSERLGKSRTSIANRMRLLNLDSRVQQYVIEGAISEGHARALLGLKSKEVGLVLAQKIVDEELSVRDTEKLVKKLNIEKEEENLKRKDLKDEKLNIYYKDIQNKLREFFGTKVNISSKKDKGKIEIEYYSSEDLQRIIDMIDV